MHYLHAKFHQNRSTLSTKNCVRNSKIWKIYPKHRLFTGDNAIIWQGCMNHGLKFLKGTVSDAPKKFHDPESIFRVSNNNFWRPLYQKLQILPILGLFSTCNLGKSRNIAQKLLMHLLWTLTKTPEKIFDVQNFLSTKIFAKTGFFRV